ncbi:MAG: response regulator [Betaproteobacteria bacterium]
MLKILVVDDNVDAAETTGMLLELMGHDIARAHDGAEAIATATSWRPALVLLDINLPVLSGLEVARRLRANEATRETYIVALSGYTSPEDQRASLAAGCDEHIGKPFDMNAIEMTLAKAERAAVSRLTPVSGT